MQHHPAYPECVHRGVQTDAPPEKNRSVHRGPTGARPVLLRRNTITSMMNVRVLSIILHLAKEQVIITASIPAHFKRVGHLPSTLR